ncbi:unnamed protein product [Vitrella brassicaformis CCMP3155]|uniref:U3 small nucleolar RNA-associated protein 14 n=3 Tax=Vitrella brassicaformis TaxID=1169539 RepID=A0A0G4EN32_VITBC|nr:unnamed protein product [Vitrella brassicaformis CCMP3155]|eukprot:CEL98405.1 unnamed protein product [Vitrella brassicaformis CCMP3155]
MPKGSSSVSKAKDSGKTKKLLKLKSKLQQAARGKIGSKQREKRGKGVKFDYDQFAKQFRKLQAGGSRADWEVADDESVASDEAFDADDEEQYGETIASIKSRAEGAQEGQEEREEWDEGDDHDEQMDASANPGLFLDRFMSDDIDMPLPDQPPASQKPAKRRGMPSGQHDDEGEGEGDGEEDADDLSKLVEMPDENDAPDPAEQLRRRVYQESRPESVFDIGPDAGGRRDQITTDDILATLQTDAAPPRGDGADQDEEEGEGQRSARDDGVRGAASQLRSELETLQRTTAVSEPLSEPKAARVDRKLKYDFARKDIQKWLPQVKRNRESEQLQLGQVPDGLNNSMANIVSSFKPSTDFEKELLTALEESGLQENDRADEMPDVGGGEESATLKRLKALMFREQRRNARLAKIKSKTWHKVHRKAEAREKEKLMARLAVEDPELAQSIQKEYEEKRARVRMLERSTARKKWARLAARFGGKAVQPLITEAAQREHDEKAAIDKIAKTKPGNAYTQGEDSDEEVHLTSDEEEEDDDKAEGGGGGGSYEEQVKGKAKLLALDELKQTDEPLPDTGLFALPFMRKAIEEERESSRREAEKLLQELEQETDTHPHRRPDPRDDLQLDQEDKEPDDHESQRIAAEKEAKQAEKEKKKKAKTVRFREEDLEKAREEVKGMLGQDGDLIMMAGDHTHRPRESLPSAALHTSTSTKVRVDQPLTTRMPAKRPRDEHQHTDEQEHPPNPWIDGYVPPKDDSKKKRRKTKKGPAGGDGDGDGAGGEEEDVLAGFDVGSTEEREQQRELLRQTFQSSTHEDDFVREVGQDEDEKLTAEEKNTSADLPGWGEWAGSGVRPNRRKQREKEVKERQKQAAIAKREHQVRRKPVSVTQCLDRKAAKYYTTTVPHPYQSKQQYDRMLQHPTGPDWNTTAVFHRLIQPKLNVRVGAVVPPLQHAKHLSPKARDSLLRAWDSKAKPQQRRTKL